MGTFWLFGPSSCTTLHGTRGSGGHPSLEASVRSLEVTVCIWRMLPVALGLLVSLSRLSLFQFLNSLIWEDTLGCQVWEKQWDLCG